MILHLYQCPPGEQSVQSASLGSDELPRCTAGEGEWLAVEIPVGTAWTPSMEEIAALVGAAVFAWGIAWGFRTVIRFAYGRK